MTDDPVAMGNVAERRKRATARVLRLYCVAYWAWAAPRLRSRTSRAGLRAAVALLEGWAETGVEPNDPAATVYAFWSGDARMAFGVTTLIAAREDRPRHRSAG